MHDLFSVNSDWFSRILCEMSDNELKEAFDTFDLSSHKLRHNFATNYCIDHVRQTGKTDVYDLSILMGHESIETTKKYEHFAHEIIAAENNISHLDMCLGNGLKTGRG